MKQDPQEPWQLPEIILHSRRILDSFVHWTGAELGPFCSADGLAQAKKLFEAPFPVLSQGTGEDPVFNYANRAALDLFEYSWEEMLRTPSKLSAEAARREQRAQALAQAIQKGFIRNYSGVRITRLGRRFMLEDASLWCILDGRGGRLGLASALHQVRPL